jgi:NADPH:quinone reductase-like Zn-dependent oxidoreductase
MLESFEVGPTLQEIPTPQVAPNEVLVRVHASSVNPVDNAIVFGMLKDFVEHEFPIVLGRDFSGVVEQAGSDVSSISEGEEVFGCSSVTCRRRLRDWRRAGLFERLHQRLLDRLGKAGRIDWSRASLDSASTRPKGGREDRTQSTRPRQGRL